MKKLILLFALVFSTFAFSQLKGSGKTITKSYNYTNFDKIHFENLDGNLEVEIGKPFSISVTIDDNLIDLLQFSEDKVENDLTIALKGNERNKMYIEKTSIKIKINLPEASVISNNGNSDLFVTNVVGRYFKIENTGNGNVRVSGSTDLLDIYKMGNGDILSQNLSAKTAVIESGGNGNVTVNISDKITAKLSGNGNVENIGKAGFDSKSTQSGNGKLIRK